MKLLKIFTIQDTNAPSYKKMLELIYFADSKDMYFTAETTHIMFEACAEVQDWNMVETLLKLFKSDYADIELRTFRLVKASMVYCFDK